MMGITFSLRQIYRDRDCSWNWPQQLKFTELYPSTFEPTPCKTELARTLNKSRMDFEPSRPGGRLPCWRYEELALAPRWLTWQSWTRLVAKEARHEWMCVKKGLLVRKSDDGLGAAHISTWKAQPIDRSAQNYIVRLVRLESRRWSSGLACARDWWVHVKLRTPQLMALRVPKSAPNSAGRTGPAVCLLIFRPTHKLCLTNLHVIRLTI